VAFSLRVSLRPHRSTTKLSRLVAVYRMGGETELGTAYLFSPVSDFTVLNKESR